MRPSSDAGFTLIEVLTTSLLLSALLAIGTMPFLDWQRQRAQKDSVRQIVAELRHAQTRATAEGATYRVDVTADGIDTFKVVSGTSSPRGGWDIENSRVELTDAAFTDPKDGSVSTSVWFYPRGNASDGSLNVIRADRDRVYSIEVEGLTSRVSYTE